MRHPRPVVPLLAFALVVATVVALAAQPSPQAVITGPVGPSPYDIVRFWHKPFSETGYAFGGNSGVFAESPNRIFVAQRGEFRLPDPVPPNFLGFAGSIGFNVLTVTDRRVWKNCLYTLDGDGRVKERWTQWDKLCEGSDGPGPHRLRISPYDPEHRVWVINETFDTIYVFSNDGTKLLRTLGDKNVPGKDGTHFAKPQDVAFLPDGRILVADGLDNHRVMILDRNMNYLGEVGGFGKGPGQFNGVHAVAVGPGGRVFALDRSGGRINVFKTTTNPATLEFVEAFTGFSLPLDLIVNDDSLWVTDLNPLRFNKLDFQGNHLYTWMVPRELPDGYLEVHTFSVDSNGTLYGGDNQYGRTQKFVPKSGADSKLLIAQPWRGAVRP
jgi:DNA-binding beta-propeller fold protein YncE